MSDYSTGNGTSLPYLSNLHDMSGLSPSEMEETLHDPYEQSPKYARAAVYFLCATIGIFGLVKILHRLRSSRRYGSTIANHSMYRKLVALFRTGSRQQRLLGMYLPAQGAGILILSFVLYILIWSLGVWPYYRSRWNVGSPPLAIRTGLFALGIFPFILMLGAKVNLVSFVTGVSHEKLQVYHQWLSQLFLVLSLLHTFPFLVLGLKEERPGTGMSQIRWSWSHKIYYWTGSAALICLAWLCWGSLSFIRNRHYEIFKLLHYISGILFFGFFYVHCNALLGSWQYLWATCALYGFSVFARIVLTWYRSVGITGFPRAELSPLPAGMTKINIELPAESEQAVKWKAGQHFFLRFVGWRVFENHPFTVANACPSELGWSVPGKPRSMVILAKNMAGLTARLAHMANARGESPAAQIPLRVILDGPYGGMDGLLSVYDRVLLISGGSGVSFTMSLLEELAQDMANGGRPCRSVHFVWAVRDEDAVEWLQDALLHVVTVAPKGALTIDIYVTESSTSPPSQEKSLDTSSTSDLGKTEKRQSVPWTIHTGRPSVSNLIESAVGLTGSLGVGVCGPESLTYDARNACASAQLQILRGRVPTSELYLHTEEFGW